MTRKPIYSFDTTASLGIDKVPVNNTIIIEDYDGNGTPKQVILTDKTGVTGSTTIADLLGLRSLWKTLDGGYSYVSKTSAYTAYSGDYIYADTTGGTFIITLPITPTAQDSVTILDNTSNFDTQNLTVARNGETIMGLEEDMNLDVSSKEYKFTYNGSDWRVVQ